METKSLNTTCHRKPSGNCKRQVKQPTYRTGSIESTKPDSNLLSAFGLTNRLCGKGSIRLVGWAIT